MVVNVAEEAIAGRNYTQCGTKIYFLNSYFFQNNFTKMPYSQN